MRRFTRLALDVGLMFVACSVWFMPLKADDPVFSGPQVGEKLPPFQVRGVLEDDAGKLIDFVAEAKERPIVLIFVHEATRPSIGFTRALTAYTLTRAKDGVATGTVWLDSDATAAENTVKRVKHALTPGARIGVSVDGQEGPGSYGLNRNVMLTILVGKAGKVTANFALVQPSLQADLPKVLEKVVEVAGGSVPKLSDLPGAGAPARMRGGAEPDQQLRTLLRPLIRLDATPEQVDEAARSVEAYIAKNKAAGDEIGRIANTIIGSGKLTDYGTKPAQEVLRKWAKTYGATSDAAKPEASPPNPSTPNPPTSKSSASESSTSKSSPSESSQPQPSGGQLK